MSIALLVTFLSFGLTWVVRHFAIRKSILDIPNDRSSHSVPTPRGGGLAVAIAWFVGISFLFLTKEIPLKLFAALLCGIPLVIIGFIDDILHLKPRIRFVVQLLSAAGGLYFLGGLHSFPLASFSLYNFYLLNILSFIAVVWFINLFNFLDGIDGYISMETIFIGIAFYFFTGSNLGLILAAATLGFLFWNVPLPKAKIFMGDVGSTLLGFTVAMLIIYYQNTWKINIPSSLILTSVFWFDATYTLYRRFRVGDKLSEAHRKHAYQRLVQSGFTHGQVGLWALVLNFMGIGFILLASAVPVLTWGCVIADILFLWLANLYVDRRKPF